MLAHVRAVSGFITASKNAITDEASLKAIQETQVANLVSVIKKSRPTMEDASTTLNELAKPSGAFTDDQRARLASAVASVTSDGNIAGTTAVTTTRAQTQTHLYMMNYMTSSDWVVLQSPGTTTSDKMNTLVNRCLSIGLLHPTEKTIVALMAILFAVVKNTHSADEKYQLTNDMKKLWKTKRASMPSLSPTCLVFPMNVAEFRQDHTSAYGPDDMPVMCQINTAEIEEMRLSTAARRTHKSLSTSSATSSIGREIQTANHQDVLMAMLAKGLMQGSLNLFEPNPKRSRHNELPLHMSFPSRRCPLALLDREDGGQASPGPYESLGSPGKESSQAIFAVGSNTSPVRAEVSTSPIQAGSVGRSTSGIDVMIGKLQEQIKANSTEKAAAKAVADDAAAEEAEAVASKPKGKAKSTVKGTAKAKVVPTSTPKAKAKATATTTKKPPASSGSKKVAKPKGKAMGAPTKTFIIVGGRKVLLGCAKCRGRHTGCGQCHSPTFEGKRFQA